MDAHEYLDFELEIGAPNASGVAPVSLLNAPGGNASGFLDLTSLSPVALGSESPATLQDARTAGAALFDALFRDQILSRYDVSLQMASQQQKGLRIRLRLFNVAVQRIRWELLLDARTDDFLALSRNTPIVRYMPVGAPVESLEVELPLRVLALIASPSDLPPIDRQAETQNLQQSLAPMQRKRAVEVIVLDGQGLAALHSALERGPWHIFHYAGHAQLNPATGTGELLLAGADGASQPVSAQELAQLLADQKSLRLCVLGACEGARAAESQPFSSLAAALLQEGVPAVLAMSEEISVSAAREFTRAFFGAITASLPVDAAVASARAAMKIASPTSTEWATPALLLRSPNAVLWRANPVRSKWLLPALAAVGLLLVATGIWFLVTEWVQPTWYPSQMSGRFNIAIADFGQLDEAGAMQSSALGSDLSKAIYSQLQGQFAAGAAASDLLRGVEVWHDSAGRAQKNVRFGTIEGANAEDRGRNAAELAERVNAGLVLYGYFDAPTSADDTDKLHLEFYYREPEVKGEPSPVVGNQAFGSPLQAKNGAGAQLEREDLMRQAERRANVLAWITQGMLQMLLNEPQEALRIFKRAEEAVEGLSATDGLDLIYLLQAHAAQSGRMFDVALEAVDKALEMDPNYVSAMLVKSAILVDKSQFFYVQQEMERRAVEAAEASVEPAAEAAQEADDSAESATGSPATTSTTAQGEPNPSACTDPESFSGAAQSPEEAVANAQDALAWSQQAAALARTSLWPGVEPYALLNVGLSQRMLGQIAIGNGDYSSAQNHLRDAGIALENSMASFSIEKKPQSLGWVEAGMGGTRLTEATIHTSQAVDAYNRGDDEAEAREIEQARALLVAAIGNFQRCIDAGERSKGYLIFEENVLNCACTPYKAQAEQILSSLGGQP